MPKFELEWTEEAWYRMTIEAKDKQEAIDKWASGIESSQVEPYGHEIQDNIDVTEIEESN